MSKRFKINLLAFFAIFLTLVSAFILPFLSNNFPNTFNKINLTENGGDLSEYNVSEEREIYLTGAWEFFWDKHIISEKLIDAQPDMYVQIPSSWTTYKFSEAITATGGIASYRTYLKNINSSQPIIISVPNLSGLCRVFIDGECVFSSRTLPNGSYTVNNAIRYSQPFSVTKSNKDFYEVVVEVECSYSSGLTSIPVLSTYSHFQSHQTSALAVRYLFIGTTVFFALSTLLLGIMRKRLGNQFWLVVLCVTFIFRMLISNEGYMGSYMLFGNLDYEITTSLIYVSTYIIKLSMLMYISAVLDLKIHYRTLFLISALFLICAFVPYIFYDYIYITNAYIRLQAVAYIVDALIIYKISEAVISKKKTAIIHLISYCITAATIVIDNYYLNGFISENVSLMMPFGCTVFITCMVFIHTIDTVKLYQQAQKTAELSRELSELNMTLMISQIQPHFLYNALNTIKYLIKKDPKTAETAIVKFSNYLRANMDSLTQKEPIPFTKEIEHVKNYTAIESLRFGERLNVIYNIQYDNFNIPPLTIQPIVENSIKHGVNQRPEGGFVKITSYEDNKNAIIVIEDNGVGFDATKPPPDDGRSHVGIKNIKQRLSQMLNASVDVTSVLNEGTKTVITIPKEDIK